MVFKFHADTLAAYKYIDLKKDKKSKNFLDKPFYEGGNKALRAFVSQHLVYPESVLKEGIKGTVVVKYTINHKGFVIETKVLSGIGHGCNEAAEAVVRKLQFQVGTYRNIKVLFHKTIKIHFHAEVKKKAKVKPAAPQLKSQRSLTYSVTPSKSASQSNSNKTSPKKSYFYTVKIS